MLDQNYVTAVHEIGHAVIAHSLGVKIQGIHIGSTEEYPDAKGVCLIQWNGASNPKYMILTSLAGLVAEWMLLRKEDECDLDEDDLDVFLWLHEFVDDITDIEEEFGIYCFDLPDLVEDCLKPLLERLQADWSAVLKVAKKLQKKGFLDREEFIRLYYRYSSLEDKLIRKRLEPLRLPDGGYMPAYYDLVMQQLHSIPS
ncbi:M50 family metallopeptidase [Candidatus Woesearchaeota archaeon]|nr:M50 family metallopeptidase [Candidatus Woesearchaeota archaeon]